METDENIEKVARAICKNLGLDPEHQLYTGAFSIMTPKEKIENGPSVHDVAWQVLRWQTFRATAAEAIAIKAALKEVFHD